MPYQSKMWSWNQDYFEGLKEIGEAYSGRANFEYFSTYCLLKERGLKKKANAAADEFAKIAGELPILRQREIAAELAETTELHPRVHSLINYPIHQFIKKTLKAWIAEEPQSLIANRFYAFYGGGQEFLEAALAIKADDQISLVRLSYWLLDDFDFMVHHLDEGCFLGNEKEGQALLKRVAGLVAKVEDKTTRGYLLKEYESYEAMLRIWLEYKQTQRAISFPEWASEKGFDFRFPAKLYYNA